MNSKKAIVIIPGFRMSLYDFFLDSLQTKEEYGFKTYGEIENKDNLDKDNLKITVNLEKSSLNIYEVNYFEGIPDVNLTEWINLLSSIHQFFYWLIPGYDWLTQFRCSYSSDFRSKKAHSGSRKPHKKRVIPHCLEKGKVNLTHKFRGIQCKLKIYIKSFNGYPLTLTLSYIVFYITSAIYLFLILADSFDNSSIDLLNAISKDITRSVDTFANHFCNGNSHNQNDTCAAKHILAWISVLTWILSTWFFLRIRFLLGKLKFAQKYLEDEFLRIEIRNRVLKVINTAISQHTEVIIIAHSFGVLVGADSIGHAFSSSKRSIKFISLGNSLSVLSIKKYELVRDIVKQCIQRLREINSNEGHLWIDYRAEFDSLSSQIGPQILEDKDLWSSLDKVKVEHKDFDFPNIVNFYTVSNLLKKISNCWKKYSGAYHLVYFQENSYINGGDKNTSVINDILKKQIQV